MLVGFSTDITDWKRAEEALRDAEEALLLAEEAAGIGIWQLDVREGKLVASPSLWRLLRHPPIRGAVPFETWQSMIHHEDRSVLRQKLREALSTSAESLECDFRVCTDDGTVRWIGSRVRIERNSNGRLKRLRGASFDVTEARLQREKRQELLEAERVARTEAERASRLKDEFLATLSHELRTPLTSILGWANLLRSGDATGKMIEKGLETIERNARAQTRLIEDLLDMSRIISGKVRLEARPIEIRHVVSMAEEAVRNALSAKGLSLSVDVPRGLVVFGDPGRLQQVLLNLLTNSIKFTHAGGEIRIEARREGENIHLTVCDNGAGIAEDFLPFAFDRFRQAEASCTRTQGGLGLGLSIVKHLVDLHGGSVTAESDGFGRGATFTVVLPSCDATSAKRGSDADAGLRAQRSPIAAVDRPLEGVTTLVVDDDDDSREILGRVLEESGAEVELACSAEDALSKIRSAASTWCSATSGCQSATATTSPAISARFRRSAAGLPPRSH